MTGATPRFAAHFGTAFASRFPPVTRLFAVHGEIGYNWFDPAAPEREKLGALSLHDDDVMRDVGDGEYDYGQF